MLHRQVTGGIEEGETELGYKEERETSDGSRRERAGGHGSLHRGPETESDVKISLPPLQNPPSSGEESEAERKRDGSGFYEK